MDDADRRAIIDLTIAYCWALDGHDWDRLDDIFTPDATAALGPEVVGLEAIKRRVREALEPLAVSQHMVSTHEVRVDADRATARCYLHAQHVRDPSGAPQFVVAGRYEDELVRTDGRMAHQAARARGAVDGWRPGGVAAGRVTQALGRVTAMSVAPEKSTAETAGRDGPGRRSRSSPRAPPCAR